MEYQGWSLELSSIIGLIIRTYNTLGQLILCWLTADVVLAYFPNKTFYNVFRLYMFHLAFHREDKTIFQFFEKHSFKKQILLLNSTQPPCFSFYINSANTIAAWNSMQSWKAFQYVMWPLTGSHIKNSHLWTNTTMKHQTKIFLHKKLLGWRYHYRLWKL